MRIWLIQVGEPLPVAEGGNDRMLRTGLLARALVAAGHEVLWWAATFDHFKKQHWFPRDTDLAPFPGLRLRLLHGRAYRSNVSVSRLVNHLQLARRFRALNRAEVPPDLLVASLPPVELAAAAVRYARRHAVPVVLDIRDLWPDALVDLAPAVARPVAHLALGWLDRGATDAARLADALTAVSESYLDWGLRRARRERRPSDRVFPLAYAPARVDEPRLRGAEARLRAKGVDPAKKIVWFIGTFGRSYDLDTVIEAARRLEQSREDGIQVVLTGSGEKQPELEARARGLANTIFTGWADEAMIAWLMQAAWVGVAGYAANAPQSLPNKLIEYLSAGLPVLSSLRGEAAELLTANACGICYRAGDAGDLTQQIIALSRDPARHQELARHARRLFAERFEARQVYGEMVKFLAGLAARPDPSLTRRT